MRFSAAISKGGRRFASATNSGGEGVYIPPAKDTLALSSITDTMTKTTDANGNKLNLRNKIGVIWRDVTFTGTITGVLLQFRVKATQAWNTAATDYADWYIDANGVQQWTLGTGIKITTNTAPTDIAFQVFDLGLAAPTVVEARDMTDSVTAAKWIGGETSDAAVHDAFRVVLAGTSPDLTAGTQYVIYY